MGWLYSVHTVHIWLTVSVIFTPDCAALGLVWFSSAQLCRAQLIALCIQQTIGDQAALYNARQDHEHTSHTLTNTHSNTQVEVVQRINPFPDKIRLMIAHMRNGTIRYVCPHLNVNATRRGWPTWAVASTVGTPQKKEGNIYTLYINYIHTKYKLYSF